MSQLVCSPWHSICLRIFCWFLVFDIAEKSWGMKKYGRRENLKFEVV